jgi:ABC-type multidrug transport system ATPase subunit
VPEKLGLYPDLTAAETLEFIAAIHGLPRAESRTRTAELLDQAGLAAFSGRRVGRLSGGMRQKLALCAALVPRPELLLLDEPTAGIDPLSRLDVFASLKRLSGEGATILMTTASPAEARRAEFLIHLWNGRGLQSAPVRRLEEELGRDLRDIILDTETAAERENPA